MGIYGVTIILAVPFLLLRRLLDGDPFFPPAKYRSYTIINQRLFLELYDADQLPKAPIEELTGEGGSRDPQVHLIARAGLNTTLGTCLRLA